MTFKIFPVVFFTLFTAAPAIAEQSLREQMANLPEQHGDHPGAGSLAGAAPILDGDISQFPDLPDGCAAERAGNGSKPNEIWLGQCVLGQQNKKAFANMLWDDVTETTKKSLRCLCQGTNFYPALAECLKGRANLEEILRAADKAGSR